MKTFDEVKDIVLEKIKKDPKTYGMMLEFGKNSSAREARLVYQRKKYAGVYQTYDYGTMKKKVTYDK